MSVTRRDNFDSIHAMNTISQKWQISSNWQYNYSLNSTTLWKIVRALHWRHNGRDSVSNHQSHDCLLNRLFRRRSKKRSKLRVTGLCVGNSPGPVQRASYAEIVSIWWRHHGEGYMLSTFQLHPSRVCHPWPVVCCFRLNCSADMVYGDTTGYLVVV